MSAEALPWRKARHLLPDEPDNAPEAFWTRAIAVSSVTRQSRWRSPLRSRASTIAAPTGVVARRSSLVFLDDGGASTT